MIWDIQQVEYLFEHDIYNQTFIMQEFLTWINSLGAA